MKVCQSWTFQELWTFLQLQSQKPSSTMMKLALLRTATGKEDAELPLLQVISSFRVTSLRNCSPDKCFTEFKKQTHLKVNCSEETESGLHSRISAKKSILKGTNNKKTLAWPKKHKQWTLAWRRRCDGALLVTLSVIYLEFQAHLTSIATTEICSNTPSHQVCA